MAKNIFNSIRVKKPPRSGFDLSHDVKLTLNMGDLIPINCMEVLPGDKVRISSDAMFRMMPMIAPIMHRVNIYVHHFFVPNRILWDNWETFITGSKDGNEQTAPAYMPIMCDGGWPFFVSETDLADYLGLPLTSTTPGLGIRTPISALPFAAYQRIWAEYYRDQNLQPLDIQAELGLVDGLQPGPIINNLKALRKRAWEHDYFTAALPWAQKGDSVTLPLDVTVSGSLDVELRGDAHLQGPQIFRDRATGTPAPNADVQSQGAGFISYGAGTYGNIDPNGTMEATGSLTGGQTSTTIDDLRTAWSIQQWLEKLARGGSRYFEVLKSAFNVNSPDARLQRPEYLGGSRSNMGISEVLQTSQSDDTAQGNMAGHGIAVTSGRDCSYFVKEHGQIMSILSILPKTGYMQGIPRMFSKLDRYSYYWPDFARLGEQEIQRQEVYYDENQTPEQNQATFGYIPRYDEYRYLPSRAAGAMRTSLKYWHMVREFSTPPSLNGAFVISNPTHRIFAVDDPDEQKIVAHIYNKVYASRPMPKYGTPATLV